MSEPSPRLPATARIWLDVAAYALAVALLALVLGVVLGIAFGGSLVLGKQLLFLGGWLLIAYATLRLWPTSPEDLEQEPHKTQTERSRLQATVQRLPPVSWMRLPAPDNRIALAVKLFLAGIAVLGLSLMMEIGFGIE